MIRKVSGAILALVLIAGVASAQTITAGGRHFPVSHVLEVVRRVSQEVS